MHQLWAKTLDHMSPNAGCVCVEKVQLTALNYLIARVDLDRGQTYRMEEFRKMLCHSVVPIVRCPPVQERPEEAFEIRRWVRFPTSILETIVKDHDAATSLRGSFHLSDCPVRLAYPQERPGRGDNIEAVLEIPFEIECQDVSTIEPQIISTAMFLPGDCQDPIVAIKPYSHSASTNDSCDISGNGPRAATHIENGHPRAKDLRQTPMVPV